MQTEIKVTVSLCMSKTVTISIPEEADTCKSSVLEEAVNTQIALPHEAYCFIPRDKYLNHKVIKDLQGWTVDDYTVIKEN